MVDLLIHEMRCARATPAYTVVSITCWLPNMMVVTFLWGDLDHVDMRHCRGVDDGVDVGHSTAHARCVVDVNEESKDILVE